MSKACGHKSRQNRRTVRERPCLLCGKLPSDPHHYPITVARGAGDSLLEMCPVCREHHDLCHRGDHETLASLEVAAALYYEEVRRTHGHQNPVV